MSGPKTRAMFIFASAKNRSFVQSASNMAPNARRCGCPIGRRCTCEKTYDDDFSCGKCKMCIRVQEQRQAGKTNVLSKCLRARLYKDRHLHDYIYMDDCEYVLKMKKSLKQDREHFQPCFQVVYQMRITLNELEAKYKQQIQDERRIISKFTKQLAEARKKIAQLEDL